MTTWNLRIAMLALLTTLGLAGTASALAVPDEGSPLEASSLVESLSAAPVEVQSAALRVAAEPALLLQLEGIQSWSSRSLARIIDAEPELEREDLATLAGYPEAIEDIVESEAGSPDALETVAADHPAEIREAMQRAGTRSFDALARIRALQRETESAFAGLLDGLDPTLAQSLEMLARDPVAMQAMQDDLATTIELGEAWQRDPFAVEAMLREDEIPSDATSEMGDSWTEARTRRLDEPVNTIEVYVQPTVSYRVSRPWSWYWAPYYAYGGYYGRHRYGYNSFYSYPFYYSGGRHGHKRHHGNDNHHSGHKGKGGHNGHKNGHDGNRNGHHDKDGNHGKGNGHSQGKGSDRDGRDSDANGRTAQKRRLKRNLRDLVGSDRGTNGRRSSDRTDKRRARQDAGTKTLRTSGERAGKPSKTLSPSTKKRATKTSKRGQKKSKASSRGGGKRKGR